MMLIKTDASLASLLSDELTSDQIKIILDQSHHISSDDLVKLIRLLIEAGNEMRATPFIQLPLELAIVDFAVSDAKQ
jgi:hypothetical protein